MNGIKRIKKTRRKKVQPLPKNHQHIPKILKAALFRMLYMTAIPVVAMVIIVGGLYLKSNIEANNTQSSMKEYLQNKYGQEFVVEKPKKNGGGLGVEGHLDAVAYPKNDKTIRFMVMSSSSGISDGYAGALWTNEERKRFQPVINEVFGDGVQWEIDIQSSMSVQTRNINISGKVPLFNDAVNKYGKQMPYNITVSELSNRSLSTKEKIAVVDKLLILANKLPAKTDTVITYKSADYGHEKYGLTISLEKLKTLHKDDIANMFKKWEVVSI